MSNVLKFAGKTDSNTVNAVSVSNDGYIRTERKFGITQTEVFNNYFESTNEVYATTYDARKSGMIALVIYNFTGVDLDVRIGPTTQASNNTNKYFDANGENISITVDASNTRCIITPDDMPALNFCMYLNVALRPHSVPSDTSKTARVYVLDKK